MRVLREPGRGLARRAVGGSLCSGSGHEKPPGLRCSLFAVVY